MSDLIAKLESWYSARCKAGGGNHPGFYITNVAEGGWWIRVDLPVSEGERFQSVLEPREVTAEEAPSAWIEYSVREGAFIGGCAPTLLHELLSAFLSAAEAAQHNDA